MDALRLRLAYSKQEVRLEMVREAAGWPHLYIYIGAAPPHNQCARRNPHSAIEWRGGKGPLTTQS